MRAQLLAAVTAVVLTAGPAAAADAASGSGGAAESWFSQAGRALDRAMEAAKDAYPKVKEETLRAYEATREALADLYTPEDEAAPGALDTSPVRPLAAVPEGASFAGDVIGRKVRVAGVEGWLTVRDIMIGPGGKATHVAIAAGAAERTDETRVLVPVDRLYALPDGNFAVEMAASEAALLPRLPDPAATGG
ncbi:hypothetical protein [Futiania mangrovi]|uniref:PRC-barrel domain containing protein n=1 Tax=Futiania mangrovi TaxID=2959716 RepID=A0A9J6PHM7_9PROT|nr:hypothetical protein [Futiania mangrovii]MCP1337307.1 hypothetical protein [Futiania mangrovii]